MSINWYPGHMHKATKEMKELLPKVDLIIEVLDSRIPYSSENPVIAQLRGEKPLIKLLSKADLSDAALTQCWIDSFEQESSVKAMAVSTEQPEKIRHINHLIKKMLPEKEGQTGFIHVLIMGIPNVGKSTIINTLAGKSIAKTGNEPAVTKGQQKINLHNGIMLWDSPGILWPKVENQNSAYRLAVTGAIKDTAISHDDVAFFAIEYLLKAYPECLKQRYKMDTLPTSEVEFMERVGRDRGCLAGGGHIDFDKVAKIILNEFRDATIGAITLETPIMAQHEKAEVEVLLAQKAAQKEAKKQQRQRKKRKR